MSQDTETLHDTVLWNRYVMVVVVAVAGSAATAALIAFTAMIPIFRESGVTDLAFIIGTAITFLLVVTALVAPLEELEEENGCSA